MITINGQKMAKSLGNGIMVEQLFSGENPLLAQAYGPMTLRFFVLQAHYRGTLDFSNDALLAAQKGWQRMQSAFKLVDGLPTVISDATCVVDDLVLGIQESLNEDLNTAQAIAHLFELARRINVVNDGKDSITEATKKVIKSIIYDYCEGVLGMKSEDSADKSGLEDAMAILMELRGKAKTDKNWALSDQIRDALKEKGFEIKDGKDGSTWNKI
jgi:cysteinyl-tRNA synthetase